MTEAKIHTVAVSRDQIERMRNNVETIYHILAELAEEIANARESNRITVEGEDVDPPEGYEPASLECELPMIGKFHRVLHIDGKPVFAVRR